MSLFQGLKEFSRAERSTTATATATTTTSSTAFVPNTSIMDDSGQESVRPRDRRGTMEGERVLGTFWKDGGQRSHRNVLTMQQCSHYRNLIQECSRPVTYSRVKIMYNVKRSLVTVVKELPVPVPGTTGPWVLVESCFGSRSRTLFQTPEEKDTHAKGVSNNRDLKGLLVTLNKDFPTFS